MSKSWLAARIRYPALADLMGSGFHQDFWDFHESPGDVVSAFTGDPIFCARIPLEVGELLGEVDGVGARGGKVLVLRTSAGSVRYPGALVQALGRGRAGGTERSVPSRYSMTNTAVIPRPQFR